MGNTHKAKNKGSTKKNNKKVIGKNTLLMVFLLYKNKSLPTQPKIHSPKRQASHIIKDLEKKKTLYYTESIMQEI